MKITKLCLSLFFTIIFTAGALHAQNENSRAGDEIFMQDLYDATNGNNWYDNSGWNSGAMSLEDNPVGLTVEERGGELRIVELDMQKVTFDGNFSTGNNLTGTLPASIGNLRELEYRLNVKQNNLTGELPSEIGNLTKLRRLSLAGQGCELDLEKRSNWHEGEHRGCSNTGSGKRLEQTNSFSGPLPPEWGKLKNLELLELRAQYLTGTLPKEYGDLTKLKGLFLNDAQGSGPDLLGGEIPESWGGMVNMRFFHLSNYQGNARFSGPFPQSAMEKWTDLANIKIDNNNFSGPIPEFPKSRAKRYARLSNNNFTGGFPESYFNGDNSNMNAFMIADNNLTGGLPEKIAAGTFPNDRPHYDNIGTFHIQGNDFTGPIPEWVQNFSSVQFQIHANNFTGQFPVEPAENNRMRLFWIYNNNFSGDLPDVNWTTGAVLSILAGGNNFTGNIPESWESIYLNNKNASGEYTGRLWRFEFSGNNLSGEIPQWLAKISTLARLRLNDNKFTFKDILPHYDEIWETLQKGAAKRGRDPEFSIDNQKPFGERKNRTMPLGEGLTLDLSEFDYEGNQYQWMKDGTLIEGANSPVLTFSNVSSADEGVYVLRVTNPALPELETHSSEPITFRIGEDDGSNSGDDSDNGDDNTDEGDGNGDDDRGDGNGSTGTGIFPDAPVLQSPFHLDDGVNLTPELRWSAVDGADYYIVHMSRNAPNGMVLDVTSEDTVYTPGEILGAGSRHQWRVKAVKDDKEGEWSDVFWFDTVTDENVPNMAELVFPVNKKENVESRPTLVWEKVEADEYFIRIFHEENPEPIIFDAVLDASYEIQTHLEEESRYIWQVKTVLNNFEGAWGPRWEFNTGMYDTETYVDAPYLIAPEREEEYSSLLPTFEWGDVEEADHYILTVHRTDTVHAKSNTLLQMQSSVIYAEIEDCVYTPGEELEPSTVYYWKVKAVKDGVEGEWSELWEFKTPKKHINLSSYSGENPVKTELSQNYPNPFNPTTQIEFSMAEANTVSLKVYNMAGQLVATLVEGVVQAGRHRAKFDASSLASGVYIYRFVSGSHQFTQKMTLVK